MSTPAQQYLTSFARRANQRLATLSRQLAGALASGDEYAVAHFTHEGQLLSHGTRSCGNPNNQLDDAQRVFIAGKLLPLLRDVAEPAGSVNPPGLTLNAVAGRTRGQADAAPVLISGTVSGTLPSSTQLLISRDGVVIQRLVAQAGSFSYADTAPGSRYRVELTGTGLSRERTRPLVSPVLYGVLPHGATATQLAQLNWLPTGFVNDVARITITGTRSRIFLAVPVSTGTVMRLTQPNDNNADITAAFTHAAAVLDFGADGTDAYDVLESTADFLGAFIVDAHLTAVAVVSPLPLQLPNPVANPSGGTATISLPFVQQTSVTVVHNFGRQATARIYDLIGNEWDGAITNSTANSITVSFSQPLSGTLLVS